MSTTISQDQIDKFHTYVGKIHPREFDVQECNRASQNKCDAAALVIQTENAGTKNHNKVTILCLSKVKITTKKKN
jgi:hypothetical protein